MTTEAKRKKLHEFVDSANDQQIVALYSIFENYTAEKFDHWKDGEFLKELESRLDDIESGNDPGLSWEEVKLKARAEFKVQH